MPFIILINTTEALTSQAIEQLQQCYSREPVVLLGRLLAEVGCHDSCPGLVSLVVC